VTARADADEASRPIREPPPETEISFRQGVTLSERPRHRAIHTSWHFLERRYDSSSAPGATETDAKDAMAAEI
jgi:hypothetical protein